MRRATFSSPVWRTTRSADDTRQRHGGRPRHRADGRVLRGFRRRQLWPGDHRRHLYGQGPCAGLPFPARSGGRRAAPMTRVSATADGRATAQMAEYYAAFAAGSFGLVITEGIYTDKAHAQGYLFQPGL